MVILTNQNRSRDIRFPYKRWVAKWTAFTSNTIMSLNASFQYFLKLLFPNPELQIYGPALMNITSEGMHQCTDCNVASREQILCEECMFTRCIQCIFDNLLKDLEVNHLQYAHSCPCSCRCEEIVAIFPHEPEFIDINELMEMENDAMGLETSSVSTDSGYGSDISEAVWRCEDKIKIINNGPCQGHSNI